ncbi:hypothetical protein Tco_1308214, partial [Tanacetum coccineum]
IAMCYDPICPSDHQTIVDALDGYIALYLSLFSIGNLCLPFNRFCLDVFKFFKCHFPLLSPFGVARVTSFTVACKAYRGDPTIPLFRYLCSVGPASDLITFQKMPWVDIPQILRSSMTNISNWKTKFIFVRETLVLDVCPKLITSFRHGRGTFDFPFPDEYFDEALRNCLISHPFKAQTFHEPILYLDGLVGFWEYALSAPSIFIDMEGIS